jgi:endonuclease/exonuclease/phosphatase (EEP) superfamily protein YafD
VIIYRDDSGFHGYHLSIPKSTTGNSLKQEMQLTVCTLNVWGLKYGVSPERQQRMARLARQLIDHPCDVVNVQELFVEEDFEFLARSLQQVYPFHRWFKHGVLGSGLATFARYPLQQCSFQRYAMNGRFRQWLQGDWLAGKGFSSCLVVLDDNHILIVNTHMLANYHCPNKSDPYLAHRYAQTWQLGSFIERSHHSFILAGDLNYNLRHEAFRCAFMTGRPWSATNVGPTFDLPGTPYHDPSKPSEAIDHIIYASDALQLIASERAFPNVSDHVGIRAAFHVALEGSAPDKPVVNVGRGCEEPLKFRSLLSLELERLGQEQSVLMRQISAIALFLAMIILICRPTGILQIRIVLMLSITVSFLLAYALMLSLVILPMEQSGALQVMAEIS